MTKSWAAEAHESAERLRKTLAEFARAFNVMVQRTYARHLERDGWRQGKDGLWRNSRFGGSYKTRNAIKRIGSQHGEQTRP